MERSTAARPREREKRLTEEKLPLSKEAAAEMAENENRLIPKPKSKKQRIIQIVGVVAFVLVNAVVLFFTARNDFSKQPVERPEPFGTQSILFLLCAIACPLVALAFETVKYLLMMRRLGERVSVRTAFETSALGKYYDNVTPFGTGGQPFQIWNLHKSGYPSGTATAMPLASFITSQVAFVLLALVMFFINDSVSGVVGIKIVAYVGLVMYMIVPLMIILTAIAPHITAKIVGFFVRIGAKIKLIKDPAKTTKKIEDGLKRYSASLKHMAKSPMLLTLLLLLSVGYQLAIMSIPYFVVRVFGVKTSFWQALTLCLYVYAAVTIVPTPGNAGAAEGSFYMLFNQLESNGLFWAMLIWRFLCYYSFIVIGMLIYGFRAIESAVKSRRKPKKKPESE
ncbi:MAG: flippase-like domain-containing protein [Clostridia bacterium]|nr:flippase-like domain-containing protein [Clostridia bacterium]